MYDPNDQDPDDVWINQERLNGEDGDYDNEPQELTAPWQTTGL